MSAVRRRGRALVAGLLLTLAAVLAIAANVALLDQGASPGEPVGRLGRDLGRTGPIATSPGARPPQARPRPAATPREAAWGNAADSAGARENEEPEGWDDDD